MRRPAFLSQRREWIVEYVGGVAGLYGWRKHFGHPQSHPGHG